MGTKMKTETRCRTFLCDDEAKARAICLTVAKCFEIALTHWRSTKKTNTSNEKIAGVGERRRTTSTGNAGDVVSPIPVERLKPTPGRRRTLPTLGDLTSFSEDGAIEVQLLNSVAETPTNVNLGRRRTLPTLEVPDIPARPRSRSQRRGSAEPGDFYGACDYDMEATFLELEKQKGHNGKYSLLGRRGSNWEAIEEDVNVRERMRGEMVVSDISDFEEE